MRELATAPTVDRVQANVKKVRGWFLDQIRERLVSEVQGIEAKRQRAAPPPSMTFSNLGGSFLIPQLDTLSREDHVLSLSPPATIDEPDEEEEEVQNSMHEEEDAGGPARVSPPGDEEEEEEERPPPPPPPPARPGRPATPPPPIEDGSDAEDDWTEPPAPVTAKPAQTGQAAGAAAPKPAHSRRTLATGVFQVHAADDDQRQDFDDL
jgi:hypothetical protein